jgi:long-chain acyl-CoA synthetase
VADNFVCRLEASARRCGDRTALIWDGGTLTYRQLDRRAAGFARALATRGVRAGDRIGVIMPNRWPFAVALLGAWKVGATVAPLDPLLTAEERAAIVADLRPRVVVSEALEGEADWDSPHRVDGPALVLYTSGSTGVPKGAVLSHAAVAAAVDSWAGPVMALREDDVVLAVLPLSHSYGLNGALLATLLVGGAVALVDRFAPETVLAAIRDRGVTVFPGVATMFRRLLDAPALSRDAFAGVRMCLSGAAPCPWELAREWRERTGVRIYRGYGLTELFRPISYLADDPSDRPDAIGQPVPGVEVRIVDDEGRALAAGEIGELLICTPAAMDGYLDAPEETRAVLADGWFRTGDLAALTGDGYVRIEGRKRERILRGGYSVFPREVETVLVGHPAVAEAAVVGAPHPELGEEVVAFVVLRAGAAAEREELIAYCKDRLAAFKYPRRVTVLERLPRASTGKVLKARLLKLARGE